MDDRAGKLATLEEETKRKLEKLKASSGKAPGGDTHDLSEASQQSIARQQELKDTIEKRKRARELAVPTNDNSVKLKLREAGEPICLFGEAAPEDTPRQAFKEHDSNRSSVPGGIFAQDNFYSAPVKNKRNANASSVPGGIFG